MAIASVSLAEDAAAPNDILNATLWMQRSVEYKGNAETAYALARLRLDQALADENWTAAPVEQTAAYQKLPPAIIVDLDETALDNSGFQAWMIAAGKSFDPKTWTAFVNSETSAAIPGAINFLKYADSKGVKIFYITNRISEEKPATRRNIEKLGFPMGGNVDTVLTTREKPDWTSLKGTRRAYVAKDYRILLNLGDNLSDFTDEFRGTIEERQKVYEANAAHWGHDWIVLANPSYGSFESAPFNHNYKMPIDDQRKAKLSALLPWAGPYSP
jgi:acid phosphatase